MKISELEKIILEKTTKINLSRGREILKRGDLIKVNINKIDNFYNIYGSFKCDNKSKLYNCHLKINFKDKEIPLGKCDCEIFLKSESQSSIYLCEHQVAAALSFVNQVKKKLNEKVGNKQILRKDKELLHELYKIYNLKLNTERISDEFNLKYERKQLQLNISVKEVREDSNYFDIYLFVEDGSTYPITNMEEFIVSIIKSTKYHIGKGLIYNPNEYYFSKEDKDIIEYIYEYILISKDKNKGNYIRLNKEISRRFFEKSVLKKIKFNYNYQTYIIEIKNQDLPISFTLKESKDEYMLTTKAILPIPLNEKMDLFFFDRKIYIPSESQIELYKPFYNILKENRKIIIYKDVHVNHVINLVSCINAISEDVSLDDGIISMLENCIKVNFDFEKKESNYYCNVKLLYDKQEMSYKQAINSHSQVLKKSKKMRIIESELNKNRFYYKDGAFVFYGTDEEYYNFLKEKFEGLKKIGEVNILENSNKYFKLQDWSYEAYISEDKDNNFNFSFKLGQLENKDVSDITNAYKNRKSYIKLSDSTFVDLESKELTDFINMLENLNLDMTKADTKNKLELNKIYYLNNILDSNKINIVSGNEKLAKVLKRLHGLTEHCYEIPKDLKASLREYQIKGFNWLKNLSYLGFGGILADEMGLGKTVQTIAFLLSEKGKHSLIVTPTSLIYNWKQEFDKFAPKLNVGIIHGDKNDRIEVLNRIYDYDIILTTFGTLKNDIIEYEKNIFDYLIIDEGQNINNPESQNAKFVKMIRSNNRFVLTGTPIENNLMELWALFDFIMPGYLYSKQRFDHEFINKANAVEDLKILISPYILRRTKKDVIKEMPEKIENKLIVEMTNPQKQVYKEFIKEIQNNLKNNSLDNSNITIFSYLTKLRQICLDPSIIIDDYSGGSGKITIAKEIISQKMNNHKILLFSQFTSVLTRFADELQTENIKYCYLDGNISSKNRVKLVDEFNNNENIRIFLISLKAGGTGLNLTSADIVIHFDPWWNLAAEDQATDRAHRIGQKHMVEVIKLIAKNTIEEKILLLQNDKKQLIEDVITGELKDENIINKLKTDELLNLFSS
ncbi:DEAD/DEAH box helicase [Clostridium sp.]|uniref:DEAD/DEAH box helicase n=1 Tax=Clostridium sp. TaxID=1506 RepID=UPI0028484226|nr:DEAD/DEAH box helicase [Clostridium sp.]MDR3594121.1 DEAD/DEAH box helicase [Clostridium sp.]